MGGEGRKRKSMGIVRTIVTHKLHNSRIAYKIHRFFSQQGLEGERNRSNRGNNFVIGNFAEFSLRILILHSL